MSPYHEDRIFEPAHDHRSFHQAVDTMRSPRVSAMAAYIQTGRPVAYEYTAATVSYTPVEGQREGTLMCFIQRL